MIEYGLLAGGQFSWLPSAMWSAIRDLPWPVIAGVAVLLLLLWWRR